MIVNLLGAPPRVVHLRIGNLRMREFFAVVSAAWPAVTAAVAGGHRLVNVHVDRIEMIA